MEEPRSGRTYSGPKPSSSTHPRFHSSTLLDCLLQPRHQGVAGAAVGVREDQEDLPAAEETCDRQRRDFFVSYRLHLPSNLKPGEYTLQLTIDDTLGRKTATRSIGLRIK